MIAWPHGHDAGLDDGLAEIRDREAGLVVDSVLVDDHRGIASCSGECTTGRPTEAPAALDTSEQLVDLSLGEAEFEPFVEAFEVVLVLGRHGVVRHPRSHGCRGLVAAEAGEDPVQSEDREPGLGEPCADASPVVVDEEPGRHEVRPVAEPLLKRLKETDPALPPSYEEDRAGLECLGPTLDDLRPLADVDGSTLLKEERASVRRHLDSRHCRRPRAGISLTGQARHRPLTADVERIEVEERDKRVERIGLGHVLHAVEHDNRMGRRGPLRRRRGRLRPHQ